MRSENGFWTHAKIVIYVYMEQAIDIYDTHLLWKNTKNELLNTELAVKVQPDARIKTRILWSVAVAD